MKRYLPLIGMLAVAALAAAFIACSSGSESVPESESEGGDDGGGAVSAVCAPGFEDCEDMIVVGDGPADGPLCADDATAPDCLGEEPPSIPELPAGAVPYDVTVDFEASSVDAATDSVLAILQSADPTAEVLILERFPPAAVATIHSADGEFCAALTEELMNVTGVADVTCGPTGDRTAEDPDEPVSGP